jgi:hypothetical protein
MLKKMTDIVHLVCNRLDPVLSSLYTSNHSCKFGSNNRLCSQRFAKYDALVCPSIFKGNELVTLEVVQKKVRRETDFRHSSTTLRCEPRA